jgi:bacterioferritin
MATELGILGDEGSDSRGSILALLETAYWMEIETVMSYIQASTNLEGVAAREIAESLEADIEDELRHAQLFAARIHELHGVVPGSLEFTAIQEYLQPPAENTDVMHVVNGVIAAESGAVAHYTRIVGESEGVDPVTQDMVIDILKDEQGHLRLFEGFRRGFQAGVDAPGAA